jgi:hypothetical protein
MEKDMRIVQRSFAAAMAAACLVLAPVATGHAQAPTPSEQTPNIPDQKLDQMAAAMKQVASVKQDYQQRIATANPSDQERIADEATGALEKAVTDQGLSVEEFNTIIVAAQNDPDVREKIRQRLRSQK